MKIIKQCEDCDSTDIVMHNATMKWDFEKQEWIYHDGGFNGETATYMCLDKFHENIDVIEIEE